MFGKTLLHLARYFLGIDAAHTQTSSAERECLAKLASGRKRVVEIGVYEGATTKLLGDYISVQGKLFAIDPFFPGRVGICWGRYIAHHEARKSSGWPNIELIDKFSYEAVKTIDGEFDLIFIDGDHSLEGITRDWSDWSERVSVGGLIALHDTRIPAYNPNVGNLGSYKYFESYIRHDERFELIENVDSLSVLRRK